jgi:hypothetical protein
MSQPESTNRHAVFALYQLVLDNDKRKLKLCSYNIVDHLFAFLGQNPDRYSDLKYWCILLLHQFSMADSILEHLISKRLIFIFIDLIPMNFSNPNLQKLCLHSIVRVISSMEDQCKPTLEQMIDCNIMIIISGCLRSSDIELASWSIFLLHDFVIHSIL